MSDSIQTTVISDLALRVRFDRQSDRYAHSIEYLDGSTWRTLFSSIEGSPADRWPPSPVLQQLHLETRSKFESDSRDAPTTLPRNVGLLVGMAGRSHWSMSVEPDARELALVFDVACRISGGETSDLGSQYCFETSPSCIQDQRWEFRIRDGCVGVIDVLGSERIQPEGDGCFRVIPGESGGVTARWRYRVTLHA